MTDIPQDHEFLNPKALRDAVDISNKLEDIIIHKRQSTNETNPSWSLDELSQDNRVLLSNFIQHIRRSQEPPVIDNPRSASVEILSFWALESAQYIAAKNSLILDLSILAETEYLQKDIRTEISEIWRYLGDEHVQINPQLALSDRKVLVTSLAEPHVESLAELSRKVLTHIPDNIMDWQHKQNFDKNCQAIRHIQEIERLCCRNLQRVCLRPPWLTM